MGVGSPRRRGTDRAAPRTWLCEQLQLVDPGFPWRLLDRPAEVLWACKLGSVGCVEGEWKKHVYIRYAIGHAFLRSSTRPLARLTVETRSSGSSACVVGEAGWPDRLPPPLGLRSFSGLISDRCRPWGRERPLYNHIHTLGTFPACLCHELITWGAPIGICFCKGLRAEVR